MLIVWPCYDKQLASLFDCWLIVIYWISYFSDLSVHFLIFRFYRLKYTYKSESSFFESFDFTFWIPSCSTYAQNDRWISHYRVSPEQSTNEVPEIECCEIIGSGNRFRDSHPECTRWNTAFVPRHSFAGIILEPSCASGTQFLVESWKLRLFFEWKSLESIEIRPLTRLYPTTWIYLLISSFTCAQQSLSLIEVGISITVYFKTRSFNSQYMLSRICSNMLCLLSVCLALYKWEPYWLYSNLLYSWIKWIRGGHPHIVFRLNCDFAADRINSANN